MFHLKNDLISQNLPTRYVISESLCSGYFPWWNPYINFGIPQYGDMNNGFWNPLLWVIAKTVGYNIWTITYEEMFYVLIGGWGVYKVIRELNIEKGVAIISSLSYMSCGFIVGHLQHFCWITGAGFFPYVLLFFLKTNKSPIVRNYVLGSIAAFLFVSATHPGLVIGSAYFFLFALIAIFIFRKNATSTFYRPNFLLINLSFFLLALIFSIVVVVSDLDVLRYISRGSKPTLNESLLEPTTLQCYLSFLFPISVNKSSFFATDISMRNVFIGIASLAGIIFLSRYYDKKIVTAVALAVLFFIFLAAGGIFKTVAYYALPFVGHVRLNGEFTYFVLTTLILAAACGLQKLVYDDNYEALLKRLLRFFIVLSLVVTISAGLAVLLSSGPSVHWTGESKLSVKALIDRLTFADLLIISALVLLATLCLIMISLSSPRRIATIVVFNLVINSWLALPFTGLGMKSKSQVSGEMIQPPRGIFPQELQPLIKTTFMDSSLRSEFIMLGSYSKKIGYPNEEQYPIELKSTQKFFSDSDLHHFIIRQSYVFLSTDTDATSETNFDSTRIEIKKIVPGCLHVLVNNDKYRFITFLQNDYPYWETLINGKIVKHYTSFKTFISVPVQLGRSDVAFVFNPKPIRNAMIANGGILFLGLIALFSRRIRDTFVFK
jgi:hypothetical protein